MIRLKVERQAKGWTRAELARQAGMSASDVGKIESRRLVPYDSQLCKLASVLGYPAHKADMLLDELDREVMQ